MPDPRYKLPASTRKFGGKVYQYFAVGTQKEADRDADNLRSKHYNVRLVAWRGKQAIYYRSPRWSR